MLCGCLFLFLSVYASRNVCVCVLCRNWKNARRQCKHNLNQCTLSTRRRSNNCQRSSGFRLLSLSVSLSSLSLALSLSLVFVFVFCCVYIHSNSAGCFGLLWCAISEKSAQIEEK